MNKRLTTNEAAERLGISPARVRRLIIDGRLPSEKFGRDLVIHESDVAAFERLKGGRPPKPREEKPGGLGGGVTVNKAGKKAKEKAIARWEGEGGALMPKSSKKKGSKKGVKK